MRLFVALEVSESLRGAIEVRSGTVGPRLPAASWVKPQSLHLTIAFLGEQSGADVPAIGSALSAAAAEHSRFSIRPSVAGFFPASRAPRIAWIALEPLAPLAALAKSVRDELDRAAVAFDAKRFTPHLTVCRIRGRWRAKDTETFTQAFADIDAPPIVVKEVVLFRSELRQTGALHTVMQRYALTGEAEGAVDSSGSRETT